MQAEKTSALQMDVVWSNFQVTITDESPHLLRHIYDQKTCSIF